MRRPGLPREKVLAAVVQLLEKTLIRVGNEEYARAQRLLRADDDARSAREDSAAPTVRFEFRGKSGIRTPSISTTRVWRASSRPAAICRATSCFSTSTSTASGRRSDSADVNAYLREISGEDFTAKDFRTWAGTVLAAKALARLARFKSQAEAKRNVSQAIEAVAKRSGNTKAVCRKCYIHPAILAAYMDGAADGHGRSRRRRDDRTKRRSASRLSSSPQKRLPTPCV